MLFLDSINNHGHFHSHFLHHPFAAMKLLSVLAWAVLLHDATSEKTCSLSDVEQVDPNLKEMTFDIGNGKQETFMAYVTPNVTSFYQGEAPASQPVKPKHYGLAGMFINMSDEPVRLYW